uniref:Uncharacterized protein n=1 Tax=Rhizophora mucronata TaxID=61149 RepID=A0A2P2N0K3_RHIMU
MHKKPVTLVDWGYLVSVITALIQKSTNKFGNTKFVPFYMTMVPYCKSLRFVKNFKKLVRKGKRENF